MPTEEIISALRNAIDHGESLQSAVQIMINSGYNSEDVQEASKFIGGTLSMQEPMPEEQLTMPEEKKTFASKFKFWTKNKKQDQTDQTIQKPSESMKLSSEPPNKQKIVLTQTIGQSQIQQPTQAQIKQSFQHPIQQYPQPFQHPQKFQQPMQQPQQLPQYSQQITQEQIKQSFQKPFQQYPKQPLQQPQQFQQYPQQSMQQYSQQSILRQAPRPTSRLILRQGDLSKQIQKIKPVKQSYLKEIILLIILLILIGVLAATIFFKDKILTWFA